MKSTIRVVICATFLLIAVLDARADVHSRVKIRLLPETIKPALNGTTYEATLEVIAPKDGVIDSIFVGGDGWNTLHTGALENALMTRGQTLRVPFKAQVLDASKRLQVRISFDGQISRKSFDLSPQRFARLSRDRTTRVENAHAVFAADPMPEGDGSGDRPASCADQEIRVRGRFVYDRPGVDNSSPPNGNFTDGFDANGDGDYDDPGDAPDLMPATIGADGIRFQIMDQDDLSDEVMFDSYTDLNGYFDVTICWDDCDLAGCDDPDIYVRFECDTGVVNVQDGYDPFEADYTWSTEDSQIFPDYTGHDIDFGTIRPGDSAEYPAVHIHNSITRAHRYVLEHNGDYIPEVDVQWPEDSTYYSDFYKEIYIETSEQWNEATQSHEWSHHVFHQWLDLPDTDYCNGFCDADNPNPCNSNEPCDGDGGHCVWCQENDVDAWNEGYANWYGSLQVRNWQARYNQSPWLQLSGPNADMRYTLEVVQPCCSMPPGTLHDAWITEGFVGALLRDIEDPILDANQTSCPRDAMALGGNPILAVTKNTQPIRIIEFIERFRAAYPQYEHDFKSTCTAVAPVYGNTNWPTPSVVINQAPSCKTVQAGQSISLTVQVNGSRYSLNMRWKQDGVDVCPGGTDGCEGGRISGANTETLTIANATTADSGSYTLVITSCDGTQTATTAAIPVYVYGGAGPAQHITSWGRNTYGMLGHGSTTPDPDPNPSDVINLSNAVYVSAGYWNSIAVLTDGTAWSWGSRYLGNGTTQNSATPVKVNGLTDIVAVSAGGTLTTSMALDAHGHIWTWGDNLYGQLGYAFSGAALNPGQVNLDCVTQISMGALSAGCVTSDGTLWMWGYAGNGALGQGTTTPNSNMPLQVTDLLNVVEVSVGNTHTLARCADGSVWACGSNAQGQLGDGTTTNRTRFVRVQGLPPATKISAGYFHSLAVCTVNGSSTAWAWGSNGSGELGNGTFVGSSVPIRCANLGAVRSVSGGYGFSGFVDSAGTIWTCGSNSNAQLGRPTTVYPAQVPGPVDTRIGAAVQLSLGSSFVMAIAPGARIIAPVGDILTGGCSTAHFSVSAVGAPPINYQWRRHVGEDVMLLADGGRISGSSTPDLTISVTDSSDAGTYDVIVQNATNTVISNLVTLSTPPMLNGFDSTQDIGWWNNERGNWAVSNGAYAAGIPDDFPATYSSFKLPQTDFQIELDVVNASIVNSSTNGGIWLRSAVSNPEPRGLVLAFGDTFPYGGGDVYWHRNYGSGWTPGQNIAQSVYTPGQTLHLRIEARGNTFTAWANDAQTPTTTITTPDFPTGSIALYDNAASGTSFDNVYVQTLISCDPNTGIDPVRIMQRPLSQSVASGATVALSVTATGTGPLFHQWVHDGICIPGANLATYSFTASAATAGRYECTVTNACGSVASYPAQVTVRANSKKGLRRERARAYRYSQHMEVLRWQRIRWICGGGFWRTATRG